MRRRRRDNALRTVRVVAHAKIGDALQSMVGINGAAVARRVEQFFAHDGFRGIARQIQLEEALLSCMHMRRTDESKAVCEQCEPCARRANIDPDAQSSEPASTRQCMMYRHSRNSNRHSRDAYLGVVRNFEQMLAKPNTGGWQASSVQSPVD